MRSLLELIKEEVSGFDYLNNDKTNKEKESTEILNDNDFQLNFINDSINNSPEIARYVTNDDLNTFFRKYGEIKDEYIDAEITIGYKYGYSSDNEPADFKIEFIADKVNILDGELNSEEDIENINWLQFNVILKAKNNIVINFNTFNSISDEKKIQFIKTNIKDILIEGLL